tara:strand:+ start:661 stop:822 length:162 start_codon:yes stop_codon:yes gene_type:complete
MKTKLSGFITIACCVDIQYSFQKFGIIVSVVVDICGIMAGHCIGEAFALIIVT